VDAFIERTRRESGVPPHIEDDDLIDRVATIFATAVEPRRERAIEVRSMPCEACPYRCDVPPGVWDDAEYDKLAAYDAETFAQPSGRFSCHATTDHLCHGWAVVHMNRGHEYELLALRIHPTEIPESKVPLFASASEAIAHGKRRGDARTRKVASRLLRKYPRLEVG
jgi:hypothetical protein